MVKVKILILITLLCLIITIPAAGNSNAAKYEYIRLHVIANSNAPEDQAVKLRVRDAILKEHSAKLANISSKQDSKDIIIGQLSDIEKTAEKTLRSYGFTESVKATYKEEQFPEKIYGDVVFPSGDYTALRVVIGSGSGENWWCVMFPPLCLGNQTTKSEITDNVKEEPEEESLKDAELSDESDMSEKEEEDNIKYDFKIREWFEKLKNK